MDTKENELWELVEMYMDIAEKQDEVIFRLGSLVRRQAEKLVHLKNMYGFFEEESETVREEKSLALEAFEEYMDMQKIEEAK